MQVISIHNNGHPKRPKEISNNIREYAHLHYLRVVGSDHDAAKREQRKLKAIGNSTEVISKDYKSLHIHQQRNISPK